MGWVRDRERDDGAEQLGVHAVEGELQRSDEGPLSSQGGRPQFDIGRAREPHFVAKAGDEHIRRQFKAAAEHDEGRGDGPRQCREDAGDVLDESIHLGDGRAVARVGSGKALDRDRAFLRHRRTQPTGVQMIERGGPERGSFDDLAGAPEQAPMNRPTDQDPQAGSPSEDRPHDVLVVVRGAAPALGECSEVRVVVREPRHPGARRELAREIDADPTIGVNETPDDAVLVDGTTAGDRASAKAIGAQPTFCECFVDEFDGEIDRARRVKVVGEGAAGTGEDATSHICDDAARVEGRDPDSREQRVFGAQFETTRRAPGFPADGHSLEFDDPARLEQRGEDEVDRSPRQSRLLGEGAEADRLGSRSKGAQHDRGIESSQCARVEARHQARLPLDVVATTGSYGPVSTPAIGPPGRPNTRAASPSCPFARGQSGSTPRMKRTKSPCMAVARSAGGWRPIACSTPSASRRSKANGRSVQCAAPPSTGDGQSNVHSQVPAGAALRALAMRAHAARKSTSVSREPAARAIGSARPASNSSSVEPSNSGTEVARDSKALGDRFRQNVVPEHGRERDAVGMGESEVAECDLDFEVGHRLEPGAIGGDSQEVRELQGRVAGLGDAVGDVNAREDDASVDKTLTCGRGEYRESESASGGLARDRDPVGVAPERPDVVAHPREGEQDVLHTEVRRSVGEGSETVKCEAIGDGDDDNPVAYECPTVVPGARRRASDIAAAVDPDEHRHSV